MSLVCFCCKVPFEIEVNGYIDNPNTSLMIYNNFTMRLHNNSRVDFELAICRTYNEWIKKVNKWIRWIWRSSKRNRITLISYHILPKFYVGLSLLFDGIKKTPKTVILLLKSFFGWIVLTLWSLQKHETLTARSYDLSCLFVIHPDQGVQLDANSYSAGGTIHILCRQCMVTLPQHSYRYFWNSKHHQPHQYNWHS